MFQNKRKRRRRGGLIVTLLLFLFTLTTFATVTYAWWNTLITTKDQVVEIGNTVTIAANSKTGFDFGSGLVPIGTTLINGQVDEVTGTITLKIAGIDITEEKVDLVITNNLPTVLQDVFTIEYSGDFTAVGNGNLDVEITIKLIKYEENEDKYEAEGVLSALVNQSYNITFTFQLVRQVPQAPQA